MPAPTIGRLVHYTLTQWDADAINRRRADWERNRHDEVSGERGGKGYQAHTGNHAAEGDVYPALIVRVWGDTEQSAVNLQVHLDGNDTYWATSRTAGDGPGHWRWPARA
jgi:hypothetical protein